MTSPVMPSCDTSELSSCISGKSAIALQSTLVSLQKQGIKRIADAKKAAAELSKDIRDYWDLIETVARVEMSRLPHYLITHDEIIGIGALTLHMMFEKNPDREYNVTYLSTAIKWAVRNELRNRYKWYASKNMTDETEQDTDEETTETSSLSAEEDTSTSITPSPQGLSQAMYGTVLSVDGMMDAENPFELRDGAQTPEEQTESSELGLIIKQAMTRLPERERQIIEARYFQNLKMREIGLLFNISPSRTSRIVQAALNRLKVELKRRTESIESYIA
ncbi:MAG: sigma-70 family RNA polymerase sigma factor [Vampirovibrionales bacterium]